MGYWLAGYDVVGVDIEPQPNYPFPFIQADALDYVSKYGRFYDAVAASPPCQAYSRTRFLHNVDHPEMIDQTREALMAIGAKYIIENVEDAPLVDPIRLCGLMFGLRLFRHRLFECRFPIESPPHPSHTGWEGCGNENPTKPNQVYGLYGHTKNWQEAAAHIGCDWMGTRAEAVNAIPPIYTAYIGSELKRFI